MIVPSLSGDDNGEAAERCDDCGRVIHPFEDGTTFIIVRERVLRLCVDCATRIRTRFGPHHDP